MAYIEKVLISACLLLAVLCQTGCGPQAGEGQSSVPIPPFLRNVTVFGTIEWPKNLGHPTLTEQERETAGLGVPSVTFCNGLNIRAWHDVADPRGTGGRLWVMDTAPTFAVKCSQAPDDGGPSFKLSYEISESRGFGRYCKHVTVSAADSREWTPGAANPNGTKLIFSSSDGDPSCAVGLSTIQRFPARVLDTSLIMVLETLNFAGSL